MNSSDSAEQVVKLTLEGMEVAIKIAGEGTKNIAAMIYTIMKDKEQTKGKASLTTMLKTGKPLKIFPIRAEDLKKFSQEADNYGVVYCSLTSKKDAKIDGVVDILVKEEDAPKINRIAERFNFREVDSIQEELDNANKVKNQNSGEKLKTEDEQFIDDIMPVEKGHQREIPSNTNDTVEKNLLEISSVTKLNDKTENSDNGEKRSVIEELRKIEEYQKLKIEQQEIIEPVKDNPQIDKGEDKKQRSVRGKHYKQPKHLKEGKKGKGKRVKMKKERSK